MWKGENDDHDDSGDGDGDNDDDGDDDTNDMKLTKTAISMCRKRILTQSPPSVCEVDSKFCGGAACNSTIGVTK